MKRIALKSGKPINPIARDLHTPKYSKRVEKSARVYNRLQKHGGKKVKMEN